jgi:hypothetical protein
MQLIIQNEWYKEFLESVSKEKTRNVENDAPNADQPDEKIFE